MMALHLLAQWRKSGRKGVVFLAENENRAERLGAVIHLDPSCDVLVFPRLNTLPFDQLEPSHEIAGRRSSVLRRLAKPEKRADQPYGLGVHRLGLSPRCAAAPGMVEPSAEDHGLEQDRRPAPQMILIESEKHGRSRGSIQTGRCREARL
jgi:hypothetical protein